MCNLILLIHSDETTADLLEIVLIDEGFCVSTHIGAVPSVQDVAQMQPDLIVADVPPVSERERATCLQRLRNFRAQLATPLILITTQAGGIEDLLTELNDPAVAALYKLFDPEAFVTAVSRSINAHAPARRLPL